jgi:DHA1 family bicyclomycin/chloramphenicol resistance-like MFS transporter
MDQPTASLPAAAGRSADSADSAEPASHPPGAFEVGGSPSLKQVLMLGAFVALGPLTIDLYLPGLPNIEADLGTTASAVQLTLTGTLIGLAIGQLVVGPLSDAWGRRRPMFFGTGVHVVASVLCFLAPSIAFLGAARVLQGAGTAATAVVTMAVVRDLYTGRAAALLISRLMLVLGVAPVLAPTLGGFVLGVTDWRGLFAVLGVAGLLLMVLVYVGLPETLPPERRRQATVADITSAYRMLLADRTFLALVLVAGFSMASMFAYVSGSSFVMQDQFGLNEQQFGLVFGAGSIWLIAGTQLSARLLRRFELRQILFGSLAAAATSSAVLLGVAVAGIGGLPGVLVPLWITLGLTGVAMPTAPAIALSLHGEAAGTAAALLGAVRFGIGAVAAPVVGVLGNDAVAMSLVVAVGMALALVVLVVGVHRDAGADDPAHPHDTHLRDATLTDDVIGEAELDVIRSE